MQKYLESSFYIDWQHPAILHLADDLTKNCQNSLERAKVCFEFVRDHIKHSLDYGLNPVTCRASDVLEHGTGYCYAKSHLLAALLRANGIPTGLCYQRLTIQNHTPPFCLHGLNAVHLDGVGWYRIDPRGNKEGIDTSFTPPIEKLAYPTLIKGEIDLPEIWATPLTEVVSVLEHSTTYLDVANNFPDVDIIHTQKF